ncbi:hypothetical protein [Caudoviricetes sp.]|nr:hypothetical protein [Caudoviricetes sp.]
MIEKSQYPDALHWAFDRQFCLPPSPTGRYFRVERWRNYGYVATFSTRAAAHKLARDISARDKYDARVIQLNV